MALSCDGNYAIRLATLSEIDHLASFTKLELLSLVDNPVTDKLHYRLYAIYKIPSLKMLDFQKVQSCGGLCVTETEWVCCRASFLVQLEV